MKLQIDGGDEGMTSQQNRTSRLDYGLILILMLMAIVSFVAIYSAQSTEQYEGNFLLRQAMWYGIGTVIIAGFIRLDSDQLKKLSWYLYGIGIFMLLVLFVMPDTEFTPKRNGAQSWFQFPLLGTLQPSEVIKVFLIITLSRLVVDHHHKFPLKTVKTDFWLLTKIGAVTLLPVFFIYKQPDLGTSLVFLAIMMGIVFVSGITWKLLLPIFGGGAAFAGGVFYLVLARPDLLNKYLGLNPYQFDRVYSWLDPYSYKTSIGFQLVRSMLAIGSGQTAGKGLGGNEVYLPEGHTDFIFSIIGEEYGFIGASIVISLFFVLIYHITRTALETKNPFYSYICAGVISMITFHVFQNIGMTIGVLPITGIPLPFISYGGSSLLGNMMAMGLIFSIRYHYKKYMFS